MMAQRCVCPLCQTTYLWGDGPIAATPPITRHCNACLRLLSGPIFQPSTKGD